MFQQIRNILRELRGLAEDLVHLAQGMGQATYRGSLIALSTEVRWTRRYILPGALILFVGVVSFFTLSPWIIPGAFRDLKWFLALWVGCALASCAIVYAAYWPFRVMAKTLDTIVAIPVSAVGEERFPELQAKADELVESVRGLGDALTKFAIFHSAFPTVFTTPAVAIGNLISETKEREEGKVALMGLNFVGAFLGLMAMTGIYFYIAKPLFLLSNEYGRTVLAADDARQAQLAHERTRLQEEARLQKVIVGVENGAYFRTREGLKWLPEDSPLEKDTVLCLENSLGDVFYPNGGPQGYYRVMKTSLKTGECDISERGIIAVRAVEPYFERKEMPTGWWAGLQLVLWDESEVQPREESHPPDANPGHGGGDSATATAQTGAVAEPQRRQWFAIANWKNAGNTLAVFRDEAAQEPLQIIQPGRFEWAEVVPGIEKYPVHYYDANSHVKGAHVTFVRPRAGQTIKIR